jgi:hypothetical protein
MTAVQRGVNDPAGGGGFGDFTGHGDQASAGDDGDVVGNHGDDLFTDGGLRYVRPTPRSFGKRTFTMPRGRRCYGPHIIGEPPAGTGSPDGDTRGPG